MCLSVIRGRFQSASHSSWSCFCFREKYIYLMGRTPLPINSNYYILDHGYWQPTKKQLARWVCLSWVSSIHCVTNPAGSLCTKMCTHTSSQIHGEMRYFFNPLHGPWISEKGLCLKKGVIFCLNSPWISAKRGIKSVKISMEKGGKISGGN